MACEPEPKRQAVLLTNLRLNSLGSDSRFRLESRPVGTSTGSVTLDQVARDLPGPILVKMDIDGGETDALAGAPELIRRRDSRWIIETHSPELELQVIAALSGFGKTVQVVPNAWWRVAVPELRPIPHNRWLVAF